MVCPQLSCVRTSRQRGNWGLTTPAQTCVFVFHLATVTVTLSRQEIYIPPQAERTPGVGLSWKQTPAWLSELFNYSRAPSLGISRESTGTSEAPEWWDIRIRTMWRVLGIQIKLPWIHHTDELWSSRVDSNKCMPLSTRVISMHTAHSSNPLTNLTGGKLFIII